MPPTIGSLKDSCWLAYQRPVDLFHTAGIEAQALTRLQAADLPWNHLLWTPPKVLFYFPSGVGEDVAGGILPSFPLLFAIQVR
jgi:hypothetical protein